MKRTLFVLLFSFSVCQAAPVDKHTQRTSEFGDEGKFGGADPGNTNALILWPGDSPGIVRRHRPAGHSPTTPKAIKLWSERAAGGFPVNLNSGNSFCSFLNKIENEPDLHACICDDSHPAHAGTPLSCTPALTLAQCSPAACIAGTPLGTEPPGDRCTITDWSPATDTVCVSDNFVQTRTLADCSTETQTVTGTKSCSTTCPATDWSPGADTVCQGSSFTQSRTLSDCSTDKRIRTGTKNCNSCTIQDWTPSPSSVCIGDTFTQTRREADCSTSTRQAAGAKHCPQTCPPTNWTPSQSSRCTTDQFTQQRTLSDCGTETREVYGSRHCSLPTCRYTTGPWTPGAGDRCSTDRVSQTRTVTATNQPCTGGTRPSASRTVYGSKDCSLPTCRWTTDPWTGDNPASICQGETGQQTRTVTLINSPCEGGTAPPARQTVSGTKDCTPTCTYTTGAWSPSASNYCRDRTFTQTRTVTSSPPGCKPGTPPASSQTVPGTKKCDEVKPPKPPKPPKRTCPVGTSPCGGTSCTPPTIACGGRLDQNNFEGLHWDYCICI